MADYKYTLATDKKHVITIDSYLVYAEWCQPVAYGGQKAGFAIGTSFVGLGAKIKVKGKSEGGQNLGKIDGKIRNNKFIGGFDIPEDIEHGDKIYFEVKLPDNGLSGESGRIPAYPPVTVTNMKWSAKEARRGDVLTLSADIHGLNDGTEVTLIIYDYDPDRGREKVSELSGVVKDDKVEVQWEYQYHESTLIIPTEREVQKYNHKSHYVQPEYFFTVKIVNYEYGKERESGMLQFRDWAEIRLTDTDGIPIPKEKYILHLPDGTEKEGTLDDDGYAREEGISPGGIWVEFPKYKIVKKTI